jgi:hypothetical protein
MRLMHSCFIDRSIDREIIIYIKRFSRLSLLLASELRSVVASCGMNLPSVRDYPGHLNAHARPLLIAFYLPVFQLCLHVPYDVVLVLSAGV